MTVFGGRTFEEVFKGRLGGSVSYMSDFGSGYDLTIHEFKPPIRLCADSSEPRACFRFSVSLFLHPSPSRTLSLSKINIKKIFFKDGENVFTVTVYVESRKESDEIITVENLEAQRKIKNKIKLEGCPGGSVS